MTINKSHLTIATRESPLALWQANWVKAQLEMHCPTLSIRLLGITTEADRTLSLSLSQVGGKGLFVKELEEALLQARADIAVHSMKDVPMTLPNGLSLPVMCDREDPRDALVSNQFDSLIALPANAIIGTSSLRRQSQLHALRSDLQIMNLRGNINTRLAKLDSGEFSAIVLAVAGLKRLGLQHRISETLTMDQSLPAAGQGVLGIECRSDDTDTLTYIASLNHFKTHACVTTERAFCRRLGGSCQVPIGAYAEVHGDKIKFRGLVAKIDGSVILRTQKTGLLNEPELVGVRAAEDLLQQGAEKILKDFL